MSLKSILLVIAVLTSLFSFFPFRVIAQGEDSADCAPNCCQPGYICLSTATERFCNTLKTIIGPSDVVYQNGICQVKKESYSFTKYVQAWIDAYLLRIGLVAGLVLIMYAGILYMTSGQNPGQAAVAKDIIITAMIGLAMIFLVKTIFTIWLFSSPAPMTG